MKVGDEVYCIKTYPNKPFFKDNYYYISGVSDSMIYVQNDLYTGAFDPAQETYNCFFDYFVTGNKIRKEKILKLNENKMHR